MVNLRHRRQVESSREASEPSKAVDAININTDSKQSSQSQADSGEKPPNTNQGCNRHHLDSHKIQELANISDILVYKALRGLSRTLEN